MSGGIDTGYTNGVGHIRDGLEMLVRFYDNHGQLNKVADKSGVKIKNLKKWLEGGELSQSDRDLLCRDVDPSFTGQVRIT